MLMEMVAPVIIPSFSYLPDQGRGNRGRKFFLKVAVAVKEEKAEDITKNLNYKCNRKKLSRAVGTCTSIVILAPMVSIPNHLIFNVIPQTPKLGIIISICAQTNLVKLRFHPAW